MYDASGAKLRKITIDNTVSPAVTTTTDYVNGVEYKNYLTNRIANTEGQITRTASGAYQREYDLRDHLGNTRVTFCDLNNDGLVNDAEILQSNNYYAFGLNMEMNTNGAQGNNKYQYNGKEWNDDFGLGLNDYGARMYDPVIGRWNSVDPLAEKRKDWNQYVYSGDNPIRYFDPDGMDWKDPKKAAALKQQVNDIKASTDRAIGSLNTAIDKAKSEKNDTRVEKLTKQRDHLAAQSKELETTAKDIDRLSDDHKHVYEFSSAAPDGENHVSKGKDKSVLIQGGGDQVWVHEIRHISTHLNSGGLNFNRKGNLRSLDVSGIQDEITGYRAQFAFKKESLPEAINQYEQNYRPNELEDININYLGRINKINTYQPVYQAISDSLDRKNAAKKD